jgi:hypothetical protein
MDVPRIGGFPADSTSVARLRRDRLIENFGMMPSFSIIGQRKSPACAGLFRIAYA